MPAHMAPSPRSTPTNGATMGHETLGHDGAGSALQPSRRRSVGRHITDSHPCSEVALLSITTRWTHRNRVAGSLTSEVERTSTPVGRDPVSAQANAAVVLANAATAAPAQQVATPDDSIHHAGVARSARDAEIDHGVFSMRTVVPGSRPCRIPEDPVHVVVDLDVDVRPPGHATVDARVQAFRWTSGTGMAGLGGLRC